MKPNTNLQLGLALKKDPRLTLAYLHQMCICDTKNVVPKRSLLLLLDALEVLQQEAKVNEHITIAIAIGIA